jgi:hypothetical protein
MAYLPGDTITLSRPRYIKPANGSLELEDDLKPYASLFLKPMTNKKCAFSKGELEMMCRDPLHSPQLILYLINFIKHM